MSNKNKTGTGDAINCILINPRDYEVVRSFKQSCAALAQCLVGVNRASAYEVRKKRQSLLWGEKGSIRFNCTLDTIVPLLWRLNAIPRHIRLYRALACHPRLAPPFNSGHPDTVHLITVPA